MLKLSAALARLPRSRLAWVAAGIPGAFGFVLLVVAISQHRLIVRGIAFAGGISGATALLLFMSLRNGSGTIRQAVRLRVVLTSSVIWVTSIGCDLIVLHHFVT